MSVKCYWKSTFDAGDVARCCTFTLSGLGVKPSFKKVDCMKRDNARRPKSLYLKTIIMETIIHNEISVT